MRFKNWDKGELHRAFLQFYAKYARTHIFHFRYVLFSLKFDFCCFDLYSACSIWTKTLHLT